jgi:hypothetical protein
VHDHRVARFGQHECGDGAQGPIAPTRGVVATHILPRWGRVVLSAVTFADGQGWVSKLVRDGPSPRSMAKMHGAFRLILGWAVQHGRLARDPAGAFRSHDRV